MVGAYDWRDALLFRLLRARWGCGQPIASLSNERAREWTEYLSVHGMLGVLLRYHASELESLVGDRWMSQIRLRYMHSAVQNALVVQAAMQLKRLLGGAAIDWAMLKGPALSVQLYGDPAVRASRDLDVLLNPMALQAAISVLQDAGFRLRDYHSRFKMSMMFDRHWPLMHEISMISPAGVLVELHVRSDFSPQLGFRLSSVPTRDRGVATVDAIQLPCLCGASQLAQVSRHAYRSMWLRWKWLYDCIELALMLPREPGADHAAVLAERSFRDSLQFAAYLMGLPLAVLTDGRVQQPDHCFDGKALLALRDSKILKEKRIRGFEYVRGQRWLESVSGLRRIRFQMRAQGPVKKGLTYIAWRSFVSVASTVFDLRRLPDAEGGA